MTRFTPMLALLFACSLAQAESGPSQGELADAASSTDWLLPNHSYAGQRHVALKQIDRDNVSQLRQVCTLDLDESSRFASAPLVHCGVMYVTSGDATVASNAATCELRWRHDWQPKGMPASGGSGKVVNAFKSGGAALRDGKLVRATSDSHLVALDAATGQLLWAKHVAHADRYEFVTMAPLIYRDLIIAGIGISEHAVRGWIGAFRLSDGEPVWRFNTVPDDGEPGAETWSDAEARTRGGGGVWNTPTIDTETGLL
jgi:alcohol dehydrogenase (cytochrome c)